MTGSDKAKVSAARMLAGKTAYVEVSFPGDAIYSGSIKLASRTVKLRLAAPAWSETNDWSGLAVADQPVLHPRVAVYCQGQLVGGDKPE